MLNFTRTNLKQSLYYPIVAYAPNTLIKVIFSYSRHGTTNYSGEMLLRNNTIYSDFNTLGLGICLKDGKYILYITAVTGYSFFVECPKGNSFVDGAYYSNNDFSLETDISETHEFRSGTLQDLVQTYIPIKNYTFGNISENATQTIYTNAGNATKLLLVKMGERRANAVRNYGLYLIYVKGSTTASSTAIETILINGSESGKTYSFATDGQKINVLMEPNQSTSYIFDVWSI